MNNLEKEASQYLKTKKEYTKNRVIKLIDKYKKLSKNTRYKHETKTRYLRTSNI